MTTLHEQAWDEATRRFGGDETKVEQRRADWKDGFLAGHEAATADEDARIIRLVGQVTATTMLGPQDAETIVRALVGATRTRVVTTVTELDALRVGAILRDRDGLPLWLSPHSGWTAANGTEDITSAVVIEDGAPLAVLYEPEETP